MRALMREVTKRTNKRETNLFFYCPLLALAVLLNRGLLAKWREREKRDMKGNLDTQTPIPDRQKKKHCVVIVAPCLNNLHSQICFGQAKCSRHTLWQQQIWLFPKIVAKILAVVPAVASDAGIYLLFSSIRPRFQCEVYGAETIWAPFFSILLLLAASQKSLKHGANTNEYLNYLGCIFLYFVR